MIVVVNKMDIVNLSKDRYDGMKVKMTAFLKGSGYKNFPAMWTKMFNFFRWLQLMVQT